MMLQGRVADHAQAYHENRRFEIVDRNVAERLLNQANVH
jgi:hypothetical protein